jgi:hypothetical protein
MPRESTFSHHKLIRSNPNYRTTTTLTIHHTPHLPPNPPNQLPKMPKGGSRRNDHHCPQRHRGGCRWVNTPVRHCATHSHKCPIHNMPHQTYQTCRKCDGENNAAERVWRNQQVSHRNNSSDECQSDGQSNSQSNGQSKKGRSKKRGHGKKKK